MEPAGGGAFLGLGMGHAVNAEPAILVERDPDSVGMPTLDSSDGVWRVLGLTTGIPSRSFRERPLGCTRTRLQKYLLREAAPDFHRRRRDGCQRRGYLMF